MRLGRTTPRRSKERGLSGVGLGDASGFRRASRSARRRRGTGCAPALRGWRAARCRGPRAAATSRGSSRARKRGSRRDVRLDAVLALMPDRPQVQPILLNAKSRLGLSELDVGLPQLLIATIADVRAQEIGALRERGPIVERGVVTDAEAKARRAGVGLQDDGEAGGGARVLLENASDLPIDRRRIERLIGARPVALAQPRQILGAGHAAVGNPHALEHAVPRLHRRHDRLQSLGVVGVAGEHLVADGKPSNVTTMAMHTLRAVGAMIAGIAALRLRVRFD